MRNLAVVVAASILLPAALVHAQGGPSEVEPLGEPVSSDTKSVVTAEALTIGATIAGPALLAWGVANSSDDAQFRRAGVPMMITGAALCVFGPSFGNWYAHEGLSTGLGLRIAGAGGVALGLSIMAANFTFDLSKTDASRGFGVGLGIGLAGVGTMAVGGILDIIEARHAVADYNRHHRSSLAVAPMVSRGVSGHAQTGLALAGAF